MATVLVEAMVRLYPGISFELRRALGTDIRSLKRLQSVGYIERVESADKVTFYPIEQPRGGIS